jgi:hypothetical protein
LLVRCNRKRHLTFLHKFLNFRTNIYLTEPQDHNIFRSGARFAKINKFSKFGGSIPSKTNDPRYSFLEKALSPAYTDGRNKQSVREIVKSIESLPLNFISFVGLNETTKKIKIKKYSFGKYSN